MSDIRLRFAPSPTGALHIGGVRTALYNYLLAKKHGGTFILRIEDTDQTRYVEGAEDYIVNALEWCGITPTEGPGIGGDYGPYRQSERKDLYGQYAVQMVESGHAYYAFDTAEELNAKREEEKAKGNHSFKYGSATRGSMTNSLTLNADEVKQRLESGAPFTIRLNVPTDEKIVINDMVRGEVVFESNELDDKILLKGDGMPTYHMANIVDDHLMKISHVIRGEEWLPSTAHHVLLYRALGWEDVMPKFAHLPLILKPTGKGKLSKRDGAKLGIPVFPLAWEGKTPEDSFTGFREFGFLPEAANNFLAFLGWNPGTEQEMFSLEGLVEAFSAENIGKSGARFDFDKATWFNQQYIMAKSGAALAALVKPMLDAKGIEVSDDYLAGACELMKERVSFLPDFYEKGKYFFGDVSEWDEKNIRKKYKPARRATLEAINEVIGGVADFKVANIETAVKAYMEANELGFGAIFPAFRLGLSGTMKGPGVFEMMELLGKEQTIARLQKGYDYFDAYHANREASK